MDFESSKFLLLLILDYKINAAHASPEDVESWDKLDGSPTVDFTRVHVVLIGERHRWRIGIDLLLASFPVAHRGPHWHLENLTYPKKAAVDFAQSPNELDPYGIAWRILLA